MIALAHYFTSRRFIRLSPEVIRRLTEEGQIEAEPHPCSCRDSASASSSCWPSRDGRLSLPAGPSVSIAGGVDPGCRLRLSSGDRGSPAERARLGGFHGDCRSPGAVLHRLLFLVDRGDVVPHCCATLRWDWCSFTSDRVDKEIPPCSIGSSTFPKIIPPCGSKCWPA